MQPYDKIPTQPVPQSQPMRADQELNAAGGYVWRVTNWTQLDRFLILGSIGGTYYISERELTFKNLAVLDKVVAEDPLRVVQRTIEVSQNGLAFKNDPALYVLALVAAKATPEGKALALGALRSVARIPTHLFHFVQYYKSLGGKWGRALRSAIAAWYFNRSNLQLAYHLTKYQSRDGWANADLIRLAHPKPQNQTQAWLFSQALGKDHTIVDVDTDVVKYMKALDGVRVSQDRKVISDLIREFKLPREVLPTELLNFPEVWEALLQDMPLTALVRNLGKITSLGMLDSMSLTAMNVAGKLMHQDSITRSRIHPLQLLLASKVYARGAGILGKLTWKPNQVVQQALGQAFSASFKNVRPSGKRMLVALDISSSMVGAKVPGDMNLDCFEAGGAVLAILGESEPLVETITFSSVQMPTPLQVKGRAVNDVINSLNRQAGFNGGTDLSLPIQYAMSYKMPVDCFVIITDNETWAGEYHAAERLDAYRRQMTMPKARCIVLSTVANQHTIGDPQDPGTLNAVGFDASICDLVTRFAQGEF